MDKVRTKIETLVRNWRGCLLTFDNGAATFLFFSNITAGADTFC